MFVIYFKRNYQSPLHQAELLQAQLLQSQLNPASKLTPEALNFEGIPDAADIEGSFEIDTSNQNGSPYFERYSESSNPLPTIEIRKALSDADFAFDEEYYSTDDDEIEVSNEEAREAAQELIDLGNQIEVGSEVDSDPFEMDFFVRKLNMKRYFKSIMRKCLGAANLTPIIASTFVNLQLKEIHIGSKTRFQIISAKGTFNVERRYSQHQICHVKLQAIIP
ncbi:predicted protein [Botrytis cinerea T4]|uniref:Uncharacterized protein n=1 Tax=Botryotinia fuckeliana (strain T4) TaxID=999810 RepID=G2XSF4_BOTF4|nr:predicted protein [Botrytis cinerea T4]